MRSRSTLEWTAIALGAVAQGVWVGVLGSALGGAAWPVLAGFAAATMLAAAAATRWASASPVRLRPGRVLLAAVVVLAVVVLVVAGRGWTHPYLVWQLVRDAVFCAGVALLGIRLAGGDSGPDEAFARAARAFGILCGVLALSALTGGSLQAPAAAVAAVVVAGGLHVAVVRYRALTDVAAEGDRLPAWPWLLAVGAAIVAVLVLTGVAAALLGHGSVHSYAAGLATLFAYAGEGVAWLAAEVLRALAWLVGLAHLHLPQSQPPRPAPEVSPLAGPHRSASRPSEAVRIVVTTAVAGLAIAAAIAVVALALRRLSGEAPRDETVVEERETVRSVAAATGAALGGLRRRLLSLVAGRGRARTPAERIRHRYERLERRLTRAGSPRAPGTTVRAYLGACIAMEKVPAAELASLYEQARYSARAVDEAQARRFEELTEGVRPGEVASGR